MILLLLLQITYRKWSGCPGNPGHPLLHTVQITDGNCIMSISALAHTQRSKLQLTEHIFPSRSHQFQTRLTQPRNDCPIELYGPPISYPTKVPPRPSQLWGQPNLLSRLATTTSKPAVGSPNLLVCGYL
jgi:hypothetical protein